MKDKNLFEDYIINNIDEDLPYGNEFNIKVTFNSKLNISIYIHPISRNGKSFDGIIKGSKVIQKDCLCKSNKTHEICRKNKNNTSK
jgi:hypothetical protein